MEEADDPGEVLVCRDGAGRVADPMAVGRQGCVERDVRPVVEEREEKYQFSQELHHVYKCAAASTSPGRLVFLLVLHWTARFVATGRG